jgi:hypothetical protein
VRPLGLVPVIVCNRSSGRGFVLTTT